MMKLLNYQLQEVIKNFFVVSYNRQACRQKDYLHVFKALFFTVQVYTSRNTFWYENKTLPLKHIA